MNRTAVEEIKQRIPIEELIGSYVKLDKAGKSYKARCPFHNEKTASFFVSPERGGYYCFGCNAKGDIFTFVEQFEGLDFRGALKVLSERAGVPLVTDKKADGERDRLFEIMETAAKYFEDQFARSKEAQEYVASRGIKPETRDDFRIGLAPEGWRNLLTFLKGKGYGEHLIEKAGLIKKKDTTDNIVPADHYYDRFRGRIIFPITDSSGRVVAFTGRILKDDGKSAKYLNSPETPLFNKSQILFGLDKAKSEIRRLGYSILVEGQMDLVLSHQAGIKNTVAASGTALTDETLGQSGVVSNMGLVRRLSPNIVIALDSDRAGRTAAMKAVAATALGMGMSVKIADIEGGKDPADLIKSSPDLWKDVLRKSKHVIEFELGNVLNEVADKRKLPLAIRERIFPFLSRIESEMDKAFYVKMIAEKTGLTELAVWEDLKKKELLLRSSQAESHGGPVGTVSSSFAPRKPGAAEDRSETGDTVRASDAKSRASSPPHRIDLVLRRMLGLLSLMETAGQAESAKKYREQMKKIAGPEHDALVTSDETMASDAMFETEAYYGNDHENWTRHMEELMLNFEEDMVNEELASSMGELKKFEREGDSEKVSQLAKKCQVLAMRKAELARKRSG